MRVCARMQPNVFVSLPCSFIYRPTPKLQTHELSYSSPHFSAVHLLTECRP